MQLGTEQAALEGDVDRGKAVADRSSFRELSRAHILVALASRSYQNLRSTFRIVRARQLSPRLAIRIPGWQFPTTIILSCIAVASLILDAPVGSFRGQWPHWLHQAAGVTTDLGLGGWYIVPSATVLLIVNFTDWRRFVGKPLLALYNWTGIAAFVLISTGLSGLIVTLVKRLIGRARPVHYLDEGAFALHPFAVDSSFASFPSGHSTTVGAVGAVLVLFFPKMRFLIIPVAVWIASTRIVVGAHYPSDVIAGFAFGYAFTIAAAIVFARLGYLFRQENSGFPVLRQPLYFSISKSPRRP